MLERKLLLFLKDENVSREEGNPLKFDPLDLNDMKAKLCLVMPRV